MGSEEIAKHRSQTWDSRVACILFCPLVCGVLLPVFFILFLLSHNDLGAEPADAPAFPRCSDRLAQRGDTYVRPFGRPHDFGRGGLSHVTLHGAVSHGARDVEVWQQAFAPGAATPIHRHDCEEVFVVLSGNGTMFSRRQGEVAPDAHRFGANSTVYVPPNRVHQLKNTGAETLQVMVIISKPPITVFVYDQWHTPEREARVSVPYVFDRECAADLQARLADGSADGGGGGDEEASLAGGGRGQQGAGGVAGGEREGAQDGGAAVVGPGDDAAAAGGGGSGLDGGVRVTPDSGSVRRLQQ